MTKEEVYQRLAYKLKVLPEELAEALAEEEQAGNLRVQPAGDVYAESARAGGQLVQYVSGKLAYREFPSALSIYFAGAARREELVFVPKEERPDRPTIDGLPEGMAAIIDAAMRFNPLTFVREHVKTYGMLGERIVVGRDVVSTLDAVRDWFYCDLLLTERKGADLLMADYKRAKPDIEKDPLMQEALEDTDDYLNGRFRKGAETRAKKRAFATQVNQTVGKTARAEGQEEGRSQATDHFKSILDRFAAGGGTDKGGNK